MGDKKAVTVLITLMNGDSFFAKIFLDEFQRAQDALNDNRKFIPIVVAVLVPIPILLVLDGANRSLV